MGAHVSHYDYEAELLKDTTQYSIVAAPAAPGHSQIIRSPLAKDGLKIGLDNDTILTIWDCFQRGVNVGKERECAGTRPYILKKDSTGADDYEIDAVSTLPKRGDYIFMNYGQVEDEAIAIGKALIDVGVPNKSHIGIFSNNRAEWLTTAFGLFSQSMQLVALYATLGADAIRFISIHAELKVVFISFENLKALLNVIRDTQIETIILYDYRQEWNNVKEKLTEEHRNNIQSEYNIKVFGYTEFVARGRATTTIFPSLPTPDDVAFLMYTSGTTGNPKGAIILHRNLPAAMVGAMEIVPFTAEDTHLSYLPLAHIFEFGGLMTMVSFGARVGFFNGNIKGLTSDLQALRPTILFGVPRVFQRIYQTIHNNLKASYMKKAMFDYAFAGQVKLLRKRQSPYWLYDRLFAKIRARVGLDRCHTIITSAAPCPPYLLEFLRVLIRCSVVQGYGMTEASPTISCVEKSDPHIGHVGAPCCALEMKLVDIEEMNYKSTDKPYPRGEIWVRGGNVFAGYYKDEAATAATLFDGWLATGDVGRLNPNGTISVIDRRKNMFKLSQGEYVAAEYIESAYGKSQYVGQLWVYGNSFKSTLLAVIVPAGDAIQRESIARGWWPADKQHLKLGTQEWADTIREVINSHLEEVKTLIFESLRQEERDLKGFERVQDIIIESNVDIDGMGFTVGNDCLTPTYKLRRQQLLNKYITQLKALYAKHGEPSDEKWPGEI